MKVYLLEVHTHTTRSPTRTYHRDLEEAVTCLIGVINRGGFQEAELYEGDLNRILVWTNSKRPPE